MYCTNGITVNEALTTTTGLVTLHDVGLQEICSIYCIMETECQGFNFNSSTRICQLSTSSTNIVFWSEWNCNLSGQLVTVHWDNIVRHM